MSFSNRLLWSLMIFLQHLLQGMESSVCDRLVSTSSFQLSVDCNQHRLTWMSPDEDFELLSLQLDYYCCANSSTEVIPSECGSTVNKVTEKHFRYPPSLYQLDIPPSATPTVGQECRYQGCIRGDDFGDLVTLLYHVICTSASTDKVQVSTPTTAAAIITPSMTTVSSTSLEEMSVPMPTTSEAQGHMTSQGDHVTSERTSEANHVTSEANQAHSSTVSSDNLVPNNYSGRDNILLLSILAPISLVLIVSILITFMAMFFYRHRTVTQDTKNDRNKLACHLTSWQTLHDDSKDKGDCFTSVYHPDSLYLPQSLSEESIHTVLNYLSSSPNTKSDLTSSDISSNSICLDGTDVSRSGDVSGFSSIIQYDSSEDYVVTTWSEQYMMESSGESGVKCSCSACQLRQHSVNNKEHALLFPKNSLMVTEL